MVEQRRPHFHFGPSDSSCVRQLIGRNDENDSTDAISAAQKTAMHANKITGGKRGRARPGDRVKPSTVAR
jgi:hypothetical protein